MKLTKTEYDSLKDLAKLRGWPFECWQSAKWFAINSGPQHPCFVTFSFRDTFTRVHKDTRSGMVHVLCGVKGWGVEYESAPALKVKKEVFLFPGDAIYVPAGSDHCVRSVAGTVDVSLSGSLTE